MREKRLTKSEKLRKARALDNTAHDTSDKSAEGDQLRNNAWEEAAQLYKDAEQ